MKRIIFMSMIFMLFISCTTDEDVLGGYEEGGLCTTEGEEQCNTDASEVLICSNSVWLVKDVCNLNFGETCKLSGTGYICTDTVADSGSDNSDTSIDTGDTTTDNGDTLPDNGNTSSDNGDTVSDNGDTAHDDGDSVPDNGDTVSDDGDTVSDDGDTVSDNGDTVSDDGDTTPDADADTTKYECKKIMDCMDSCASSDTTCMQTCYNNGSTQGQTDYTAYWNCNDTNSCDGNYLCNWQKCNTEAVACGLGGDSSYSAPYGSATISGVFTYVVTTEENLSSSMYIDQFITGTFGTSGNIIDPTSTGTYAYTVLETPTSGDPYFVVYQDYKDSTLKNPAPYLIIDKANATVGTHNVGLTSSDDTQVFIAEMDSSGKMTCRHAFGVGTINITTVNTTAGSSGRLSLTGTLDLYSPKAAPIYGGDISDSTLVACDPE